MGCSLRIVLAGLAGQDRPQTIQPPIQHQVTVTLKLIQVFVADSAGKPALDLEKSDFVLYDNGKLQPITDFEKHVLALPVAARAEAAPAAPMPGVAAKASDGESEALLSRKFIFLVDYVRNDLEGIQKAKTSILEFIDTKTQAGDELALYSFSASGGLKLHEDLTADRSKVRVAVERLRDVPGITPQSDESRSPDHEPMGMELMNFQIFGRTGGSSGAAVRSLFNEVASWAKVLRTIPGQKNIILYSRGFGRSVVRPGDPNYFAFQTMTRELASANARVFSVNTTTDLDARIALGVFPEDSLDHLARTTGGKYFADVNYTTEIASDIQDATASYYVLGFAVPAAWDGKYHNVKVEVRRKGYEVRAQRGYFNPVPFAKLSDIEKHVQLLALMGLVVGEEASTQRVGDLPLVASRFAAAVPFATAGASNTLILAEVPVTAIREAVGERAELVMLVLNQDKAIVDGKRHEIDWKSFKTERAFEYAGIALTAGRYDCRAAIRNLDDGRAAVGSCAIEVPELATEGASLYPPFFFVRGPAASYVNIESEKKAEGAEPFSLSRAFPFPAKEYVPLLGAMERGTRLLGAVLRCEWRGNRGGEIDLDARLFPEAGGAEIEIAADLQDMKSEAATDLYLISIDLPELPPGRYRLEIEGVNAATGSTARTSGLFSIR
ncbi:MAG TPA: VWA domain-containing protein [Acidobacteriota bacterium]|nr:VWA domain-containing protein [Acidobacteriota bacterium]